MNRPAKSSTSVARNSHIPKRAAYVWTRGEPKCAASGYSPGGTATPWKCASGCMLHLVVRRLGVVVRRRRVDRLTVEVMGDRRRLRAVPLVPGGVPGIPPRHLTRLQGDRQVDGDQDETEGEQRGARGGGHVQRPEALRILVVAPGHAHVAEQELGDEGRVEPEDDEYR